MAPVPTQHSSDGQEVAGAGVARRMAELRHGPRLDLADALTGEVEVLTDFFERARLAAVEAETQLQDLSLALVERGEQPGDLLRQQRGGGYLERRLCRTVFDDVTELGIAVLPEGFGQRQRFCREAQRLGDLVLRHLDFSRQLGPCGRATELQLQPSARLLQP